MSTFALSAIYLMFFLSGASALIYQVVWVRSFSLIFGGSHLAVATVLTVFMGGLALGSFLIGRRMQRYTELLRVYGVLEIGIASAAILFMLVFPLYPSVYVFFAGFMPDSILYLSFIRFVFAACAIIVPTTLMGATLPVLSGFLTTLGKTIGVHLSLLYAINTLGAVIGAASAGFLLLPRISVNSTAVVAIIINILIGLICLFVRFQPAASSRSEMDSTSAGVMSTDLVSTLSIDRFMHYSVLLGIGVSGFCALAYEVLWTRVLSIVVGASSYGFTIILVAFLTGIGAGSLCYSFWNSFRERKSYCGNIRKSVLSFGVIQMAIGGAALLVSVALLDLPVNKSVIMKFLMDKDFTIFQARQISSVVLAFSYMFVPAFLMGVAFPLAGKIHATVRGDVGRATGDILACNTIGAILGSALSGFVFIYLLGIERSLQIFAIINIGFGLIILASLVSRSFIRLAACALPISIVAILLIYPNTWRIWSDKWFAVYKANEMEGSVTPQMIKNMIAGTEVLYYGEGVAAIVSSVKTGEYQGFITNGRTESSNTPADMQCVYTLGHLPMLLAKEPKKVFVLGTGAGVTLGATSIHPEVEQITLVEIEPKVLGVARTFARYNHNVLENPKLKIVYNDGRNFLLTTKEKFDVITADPIHPWFSGAGYLYTDEYFRLAAQRLNEGGIICQWVPIYELTEENLKSILGTFRKNFKYTKIWLTQYDAELVGSNTAIILDEQELERRISVPAVKSDLQKVNMGSARDFLSYFIMGSKAVEQFSRGAIINTDNNVYLEFSAPLSMGKTHLVAENIASFSKAREGILPYLRRPESPHQAREQQTYWTRNLQAAKIKDVAHALYYTEGREHDHIPLLKQLIRDFPDYKPHRIMYDEYEMFQKYIKNLK